MTGKAARVAAGQHIRVINTHGTQVVDAWAFNAQESTEWMAMEAGRARATGVREGGRSKTPYQSRRQEPTDVMGQERIDPDSVTPLEMVEDDLVLDPEEGLVRTLATLHSRLLANAPDPLVPVRLVHIPCGQS